LKSEGICKDDIWTESSRQKEQTVQRIQAGMCPVKASKVQGKEQGNDNRRGSKIESKVTFLGLNCKNISFYFE
jgi:hypothetical protein